MPAIFLTAFGANKASAKSNYSANELLDFFTNSYHNTIHRTALGHISSDVCGIDISEKIKGENYNICIKLPEYLQETFNFTSIGRNVMEIERKDGKNFNFEGNKYGKLLISTNQMSSSKNSLQGLLHLNAMLVDDKGGIRSFQFMGESGNGYHQLKYFLQDTIREQ